MAYDQSIAEDGRGTRIVDGLQLLGSIANYDSPSLSPAGNPKVKETKEVRSLDSAELLSLQNLLNGERGDDHFVSGQFLVRRGDQQFLARDVRVCSAIFLHGVRFIPRCFSTRDCNIISHDSQGHPFSASLECIFTHTRREGRTNVTEPFLIVRRLAPLTSWRTADPYRRYPHGGGFLCTDRLLDPEVIRGERIVSHFARTVLHVLGIQGTCVHVLPLNRVRLVPTDVHWLTKYSVGTDKRK